MSIVDVDRDADLQNTEDTESGAGEVSKVAQWLASLGAVSALLRVVQTPEDCARVLMTEGLQAAGARAGSVAILNEARQTVEMLDMAGYPPDIMERFRSFPAGAPLPLADAIRDDYPVFLGSRDERSDLYPHIAHSPYLINDKAWAAIPFHVHKRIAGALGLSYTDPQPFGETQQAFLTALAELGGLALGQAPAEEWDALERDAYHNLFLATTGGRLVICGDARDLPAPLPTLWMGNVGPVSLRTNEDIVILRKLAFQAASAYGFNDRRSSGFAAAAEAAAYNALTSGASGEASACLGRQRAQVRVTDCGPGLAFGSLLAAVQGERFRVMLEGADTVSLLTRPQAGTTVVLEITKPSAENNST